jgi:hypothetical protein
MVYRIWLCRQPKERGHCHRDHYIYMDLTHHPSLIAITPHRHQFPITHHSPITHRLPSPLSLPSTINPHHRSSTAGDDDAKRLTVLRRVVPRRRTLEGLRGRGGTFRYCLRGDVDVEAARARESAPSVDEIGWEKPRSTPQSGHVVHESDEHTDVKTEQRTGRHILPVMSIIRC